MNRPIRTRDFNSRRRVGRITSLTTLFIGAIISSPFMYDQVYNVHGPYMSVFTFISIPLMCIGLIMFLFGFITFFTAGQSVGNPAPTTDIELARIRHAVESNRMERK